jgi:DNA primase
MAYIAKSTIQEVQDRLDAVAVVGEYVRLEKRGGQYWGLCPFHHEKTPSFKVDADKKLYYCFGCHRNGTVISFIMEMDKLSFPEAIETLAKRCGVEVVYEDAGDGRGDPEADKRRDELYELYRRVTVSFHHFLVKKDEGAAAKRYIITRGITDTVIDRFRLGYAPADRYWLYTFLTRRHYSPELLAFSGLFSSKYPKAAFFSDRLLFPIADKQGRVVAFGGRLLAGKDGKDPEGPKYLNSKESDIYKKSQTLFALDLALPEIRKTREVYIAEGYMDVIALHQAGISNAAAPLGTAFTDDQAKLLRRWAERVYLIFDADGAGQSAAVKAILTCRKNGLSCAVVNGGAPEGGAGPVLGSPGVKDPADILQQFGAGALQNGVKCFINDFDYLVQRSKSLFDLSRSEGKARGVAFLFPYVDTLDSEVSREACIRDIGDAFRTDPRAVMDDYLAARRSETAGEPKVRPETAGPRMSYELSLLAVVCVNPELYPKLRGVLEKEELSDPRARELFIALEEWYRDGGTGMDDLLSRISDDALRDFVMAREAAGAFSHNAGQLVSDGINRVRQEGLKRRRLEIVAELRSMENGGRNSPGGRLEDLLTEKVHIDGELRRFKDANT